GGDRRPAQVPLVPGHDRPRDGGPVRPGAERAVHQLRLAVPRPGSAGAHRRRDRAGQQAAGPGGDHQDVPLDRADPHAGGRGADPDHEAEAVVREPQVQGRHRRHVCRKERAMRTAWAAAVMAMAVGLAGPALGQKETRGVTPTEIVLGMHTDLSGPAATYGVSSSNAVKMRFDEVNDKAGINYFVTKKNKKALCAMYQDTDFGKEVLDGVQMQADKLKVKLVETVTHKPTDQDFTAQITKLKGAGCDLVVIGTIVRDSIVP